MRDEARNLIKNNLVRLNEGALKIKEILKPKWLTKKMVSVYLKSPPKIQFALAKFGIKHVLIKQKEEIEEPIRH